ncbi:hypothetical protein [Enterococcus sp. AZ180]|uniref:hypothetical protein n=1 Tax=Enterococcus sp. AZ180 TaxID=2774961 RepID=UPI003F2027A4
MTKKSEAMKKVLNNEVELDDLDRSEFMDVFNEIGENMWDTLSMPTALDFIKYAKASKEKGEDAGREASPKIKALFDFGAGSKIEASALKDREYYDQKESSKHMESVIAANSSDISESGYFYKKLMAASDDIRIISEDCGSEGIKTLMSNIDEEMYNYKVRFSYVEEIGAFAVMKYKEFMEILKDAAKEKSLDDLNDDGIPVSISVRKPRMCNHMKENRKLCDKCAGVIMRAKDSYFIPKNFGIHMTLLVTEHATQASLDSMNKGVAVNANKLIENAFPKKLMTWEEIIEFIEEKVDMLQGTGVQARFYELAFLTRVFSNADNLYRVAALKNVMRMSSDLFGIYIKEPSMKNFLRIVDKAEFEGDSIKTQIAFDKYY